jgi:L-alanine-DL-glutamate epimerase-like enolase superfamily enzyme
MKITSVETAVQMQEVKGEPKRDALQALSGGGTVTVTVHSDEGVAGKGSAGFGRVRSAAGTLQRIIDESLAPLVVGEDPFFIKKVREKLWQETEYHGTVGLALFGVSAIDIALWDLMGKATGQPVYKLLGAHRDRVPAYAMVGWLNYSEDELKRVCAQAVEQGYRAVKMKVGCPTLKEDVRRIEAVLSAVGEGVRVMVDANQVFNLSEALLRGRAYQDLGCYWFEEPLPADDVDGLAELTARLDIRIASGENTYGKRAFRQMLQRRAVDVIQGDLRRGGGVTELMEVAALADAFNIPYASHGGGAVQLHMLAAMPNACYLESGLLSPTSRLRLEEGCLVVPEGPGFGQG